MRVERGAKGSAYFVVVEVPSHYASLEGDQVKTETAEGLLVVADFQQ